MKGQLSQIADEKQAQVEAELSSLGVALALLEHDRIRICQAIGRHAGLLDLLGPVIQDLERVSRAIAGAQETLRDDWERGQEERWSRP